MSLRFFPGDTVVAVNNRVAEGFAKHKYGTVVKIGSHGALVKLQWTDGGKLAKIDETWFNFGQLDFAVYDSTTSTWRTCKRREDMQVTKKQEPKAAEKTTEKPVEKLPEKVSAPAPDTQDIFAKMSAQGIDAVELFLQLGSQIVKQAVASVAEVKAELDDAALEAKDAETGLLVARDHLKEAEKAYEAAMVSQQNAEQRLSNARKRQTAASEQLAERERKLSDVRRRMGE